MRVRIFCLSTIAVAVILGCGADGTPGKQTWPISVEQLGKLKKMPRAERDAWFANVRLPEYKACKLNGEIEIDGVLSEPAWNKANLLTLREAELGGKVRFGTRVRMLWDDQAVYLAFDCDDPDVYNPITKHDDDLWQHDVVEVFVDVTGDSMSYMELHVAPSGATADVLWADFRPGVDWFASPTWERFTEAESKTAYTAKGMSAAVKVDGTLNNPDDTDRGYVVEWRIPYAAMVNVVPDEQKGRKLIDVSLFKQVPVEKPKLGAVWRMNFNRCDDSLKLKEKNAEGKLVNVIEESAWAPTTGSFHVPFLFGRVRFVE
jgi:hypothetical protein